MLVGVVRCLRWRRTTRTALSPCSWGWSAVCDGAVRVTFRCPHARGGGPFHSENWKIIDRSCPHARGGGPYAPIGKIIADWLSPCSWGWSVGNAAVALNPAFVVPMLVGVVRSRRYEHVVGVTALSPCSWGWSAAVETWYRNSRRCPHARGGGPANAYWHWVSNPSCPHARGGGPPTTKNRN